MAGQIGYNYNCSEIYRWPTVIYTSALYFGLLYIASGSIWVYIHKYRFECVTRTVCVLTLLQIIGWRESSLKMVFLITDNDFHIAGDGYVSTCTYVSLNLNTSWNCYTSSCIIGYAIFELMFYKSLMCLYYILWQSFSLEMSKSYSLQCHNVLGKFSQ